LYRELGGDALLGQVWSRRRHIQRFTHMMFLLHKAL
jgi:hypothetical protein